MAIDPITVVIEELDEVTPANTQAYYQDIANRNNTLVTETFTAVNSLVAQQNNMGNQMNAVATEVNANATSAAISALQAESLANSKGAWSSLTGTLNVPASVTNTGSVWVLNVNLADVTLSEPVEGNSDWTEVSGVTQQELDAVDDKTIANAKIDKSIVITPPTDVNYTLTSDENLYGRIEIDTTNWTIARNIITDNIEHTFLAVVNGGKNATFKTVAGTGFTVDSGEAKQLRNDTVNVRNYEGDVPYVIDSNYLDPLAIGTNPTAKLYSDGTVVGSTDNANYIRKANGELICYAKKTIASVAITIAQAALGFRGNAYINPFSIEFKDNAVVTLSQSSITGASVGAQPASAVGFNAYPIAIISGTYSFEYSYIAVGIWRA